MDEFAVCPHHLFERAVARNPHAWAIRGEGRDATYEQLNAAADRVRSKLVRAGVLPGERLLVFADRTADGVAALLGVLKAGGVCVPVDAAEPVERLRHMVELTSPRAAVAGTTAPVPVEVLPTGVPVVRVTATDWSHEDGAAAPVPPREVDEQAPAFVFFTSGTTGRPQAVVHTHHSAGATMRSDPAETPLPSPDRVLGMAPMGSLRTIPELYLPLAEGACLVLAKPGGQRDIGYIARRVRDEDVSVLCVTPSLLRLLLEKEAFGEAKHLRLVHCSAEPLTPELSARFLALHSAELRNVYGQTESSAAVLTWPHTTSRVTGRTPLGRPGPAARVHLLDDGMNPVADGETGEIYVSGDSLAREYLDDPQRTALRFPTVRTADGSMVRMLRTGDLAFRDSDGVFQSAGRRDDQINVNGFRVSPAEIEQALENHPAVRTAAVVTARPARPGDDGVLTAHLVPSPRTDDEMPDTAALHEFLADRLPRHMHPRRVHLWTALPLLPSGKLDRQTLALTGERDRSGAESPATTAADEPPQAPEPVIDAIKELLSVDGIGDDDHFYALGGSSLDLMRLITTLGRRAGTPLDVDAIVAEPTVAAIATAFTDAVGRTASATK